jgi:hypothetical protein
MSVKWSPSDIEKSESEVRKATENYKEKKSEYLRLLDKRSDYENRLKKEIEEDHVIYNDCSFYMLDPVTLKFKCYNRRIGNIIKAHQIAISALKPEIDLAFLIQHGAFKRLLKAKRRLSDAKRGFPYVSFYPSRRYY